MLINSPNISGSLTVTGNAVITGSLTVAGGINATITGSATSASYVEYTNVANKPALISGSSQVTYSGLTGVPSGIVSGSSQITYSGLTGIPSGIVSGSAQIASFGIFATTGSNGFNGSQSITGSLTVTGQVVAQTLNVQQVTSSIVYSSGSNIFGNTLGNTQQFTGSVSITGSLNTSIAAFGSAATTFLTSDSGTIKSRTAAQTLSDIAALPLAGGTLTGALSGSSAVFSAAVTANNTITLIGPNATNNTENAASILFDANSNLMGKIVGFRGANGNEGNLRFYTNNVTPALALTLASTGAATFSSSVTAAGGSLFNANSATLTQDILTVRGGGSSGAFGFRVEANNGEDIFFINNASYNITMCPIVGNVLIGTTTDGGVKLDVLGTARVSGNSTYAEFSLKDNTASGSTWFLLSGFPALGDFTIREAGVANHLVIKKTTGAATFSSSVTAAGYVFVGLDGTYGPTYSGISFQGTSAGVNGENRIFAGRAGADGLFLASATSRAIYFRAGGSTSDHLTIGSTGAATFSSGITAASGAFSGGVTVSSASTTGVVVNSTSGASFRGYVIQSSGTSVAGMECDGNTGQIKIGGYQTTGDYFPVIYSDGVASLTFGLGASPSATFVSSVTTGGNITITKTTAGLILDGNSGGGNSGAFINLQGWANTNKNWQLGVANIGGSGLLLQTSTAAGGNSFTTSIGGFDQTTGVYTALSDINRKKDFEKSEIGLDAILSLKPTLYRIKEEDETTDKHLGFIAQEVKEFIPQAYSESGDFIGLDYNPIVAALVKSIQELKAENDTLKSRIDTLEQA